MQAIKQSASRLDYIDVAKGIGIILVVWYHIATPVDNLLNLFFMPLFFFLSGVCFRTEMSAGEFLRKKGKRLLLPLCIGCLLGAALEVTVYQMANYHRTIESGFYNFWMVGNVPLWFLPTLFYTMAMVYTVENRIKRPYLKLAIYLLLSGAGFALSSAHCKNTLFIGQSLLVVPFFTAGYYCKSLLAGMKWKNYLILAAALLLLCYKGFDGIERTNIHQFIFQRFYYSSLLLGFAGIYAVLWISTEISKRFDASMLKTLGRSTMYILVLHYLIVHPMLPYFEDSVEHPYKYAISFAMALALSAICSSVPRLLSYVNNHVGTTPSKTNMQ